MRSWDLLTLAELVNLGSGEIRTGPFGSQLHRHDYLDGDAGIPVVMPVDMSAGRIRLDSAARIPASKARELSQHVTQAGDLLLARRGEIGRFCLVDNATAGALCGTGSIRVRLGHAPLLPEYLAAYLGTAPGRHELEGRAVGSTMPNLNASIVGAVRVPVPPLTAQRKIAAVLSAYDDLIENNNRRIKILEEMAQRIYREWFVDFRYPGHEGVPLVDSELGLAPEGWAAVAFTDIAEIMSGGTPKTAVAEYWGGAIPFFTPKDAPTGLVATITEKHLTEAGLERCNSDYFPAGTVFITARGTVGKVSIAGRPMAMNQSCYAVRGHDPLSQEFILLALSNQVDYLRTNTGGATFDTIIVDTFRRMKMLAPPDALISRFTHIARPLVALAQQLTETTQCARTARDLLLPRLVSGEIDVTDLDIAMPEAA